MAGGTDLYIRKGDDVSLEEPYFVREQNGFRGIYQRGDFCVIGAATTITELEESEHFMQIIPDFREYSRLISGASIRNRATIGGNIINASPIGDLSILFLAMNASVKLVLGDRERMIFLKNFFLGYKKLDLQPGELLREVLIPINMAKAVMHFEKVSRRKHLDIASVNSAMSIRMNSGKVEEVHAAAGGVGPTPQYLKFFCNQLQNKYLDEDGMEEAIRVAMAEISPISDVRGSKMYKSLLLEQQLRIHFSVLAEKITK